ncbi:hypothetical protein ACQ7DA_00550 [Zafaria sp. J156]|uniref:hypothetical protein n=1 Tax=Zafaria sp. J156 TaxID=3116490 RepID=UPI002E7A7124|nr:hypothetical protein [Zafaria sp. J156]MEE1619875.1 hypothetical protein [Zafaria sp. J156]
MGVLQGAEARLAAGPLAAAGGVTVLDAVPDPGTVAALLGEALGNYASSSLQDVPTGDGATGRGGTPARRLRTAGGGAVQDAFYARPALAARLAAVCGTAVEPTGGRGSYSYYVSPGDYLGLHLDIDTCDVTLITLLRDDAPDDDPAGALLVHLAHFGARLEDVRADPRTGAGAVKARPGQSIVLLGGLLPHETVPVGPAGPRIISALCFRAV